MSSKIDFVSDVSCPWCAIGLQSLLTALRNVDAKVELHFQPFELNPDMAREGEDIAEHIGRKYGAAPEAFAQSQEMIRARGKAVGFRFDNARRTRIYNTFDAHRLLHWAGLEGQQLELKQALFRAYFAQGADVGDHGTLVKIAAGVGLDAARPGRCWPPIATPARCARVSSSIAPRGSTRCLRSSSMTGT